MKTLELIHATIGYTMRRKTKIVAADLNGSLTEGELVSLIGCNGCGKSTLLRTIAGFQPLLEGQIKQGGKDIRKYSIQERARLLSIVTTRNHPVSDMNVYELVGMGRSPYTGFWGRLRPEDERIIEESLQMVGMATYRDRLVTTLSDGERQKALIAKAIAQETPVIVLDEPTSFLDYPSKVHTMKLLARLAHDCGKTIIFSTHDLEQALQFSDRMWLLDEGGKLLVRTPREMMDEGILERSFDYRNW